MKAPGTGKLANDLWTQLPYFRDFQMVDERGAEHRLSARSDIIDFRHEPRHADLCVATARE
jgi:hypothetical protein